jgi:lipoprotein-releasing system permease protein
MWRFERSVAWRHFITGGSQTALTVAAVAIAVVLIIFISSLINGLQVGLIEDILGGLPLVTVTPREREPLPLWETEVATHDPIVARIDSAYQQRSTIEEWRQLQATIQQTPHVTGVAARATGGGFVARGARTTSAAIIGVQPDHEVRVINIATRMMEGDFARLDREGVIIGSEMAESLRTRVGDRIRVTSNEGQAGTFFVRGIFDVGLTDANERWVFMRLRSAQGLLALGNEVTAVNARTDDIYRADGVAAEIRKYTPLDVKSWTVENRAFLDGLQGQRRSSNAIVGISLLASLFAVAGVMLVFVVQKSRDIGILKTMGATRRQITRIFLLEGLGFGLTGGLLGGALGSAAALLIQNTPRPGGATFGGRPASVVPMQWEPGILVSAVVAAMLVGVIASVLPARRAAALDPVEVIRSA